MLRKTLVFAALLACLVLASAAQAQDSGIIRLRNAGTGGYLEDANGEKPSQEMNLNDQGGDHCRWEFVKIADGLVLRNVKTGMYLDIDGNTNKPMMEKKHAGKGTIWTVVPQANGRFALRNLHSGQYLGGHHDGKLSMVPKVADATDTWEFR